MSVLSSLGGAPIISAGIDGRWHPIPAAVEKNGPAESLPRGVESMVHTWHLRTCESPPSGSGCVRHGLRIFLLVFNWFLHTGHEDRPLVLDPDVVGAGHEGDGLLGFRLGIEHHGRIRLRFVVPCPEVRIVDEGCALVPFQTVDDLREARPVDHLGGGGLDEDSRVLGGERPVLVLGDDAHGGGHGVVPEVVAQDDRVAAGKPKLLAIGVEVYRPGRVVVAVDVVVQVVVRGVRMRLQDGGVHGRAGDGQPSDDIGVDPFPVIPIDFREPVPAVASRLDGRCPRGRGSARRLPAIEEEGAQGGCGNQEDGRSRERDAGFRLASCPEHG